MNILIAGDFCPKYRTSELLEQEKFDEMLGQVKSVVEQADYSIVNFECPVVNGKGTPISKCGPNLRTTAKAVDLIKYAGFKAVTLANNHFLDYGEEGVSDTLNALDNADIAHVGGGMNLAEASKTMYINGDTENVAIINCCEHEFSIATETTAGSNPLNPIKQWYAVREARENADYVIVIVHGGPEHCQLPSPRMVELFHFFVDSGADAVLNHHQHCNSGFEIYNGKPIFYGLGNLFFDHLTNRECIWNYGYMVTLATSVDGIQYTIHPYLQCGNIPCVSLLKGTQLKLFTDSIQELNEIISKKTLLEKKYISWVSTTSGIYSSVFTPWNNYYTKALYHKGFLPSFFPKSKALLMQNFIECESHHDRLVYILKCMYNE